MMRKAKALGGSGIDRYLSECIQWGMENTWGSNQIS
jgi:hypothetical protein